MLSWVVTFLIIALIAGVPRPEGIGRKIAMPSK